MSLQPQFFPVRLVNIPTGLFLANHQNTRIANLANVRGTRGSKNTGGGTSYLRHSALRTISGGICWGLIGLLARSLQLLLLGYQPIVKRSGFIGIIRLLRHANIIAPASRRKIQIRFHPPLSVRTEDDLRAKSRRQNTGDRRWKMDLSRAVAAKRDYSLISDQVIGCLSTSRGLMRVACQELSGCLAKKISPLKKRNDL